MEKATIGIGEKDGRIYLPYTIADKQHQSYHQHSSDKILQDSDEARTLNGCEEAKS